MDYSPGRSPPTNRTAHQPIGNCPLLVRRRPRDRRVTPGGSSRRVNTQDWKGPTSPSESHWRLRTTGLRRPPPDAPRHHGVCPLLGDASRLPKRHAISLRARRGATRRLWPHRARSLPLTASRSLDRVGFATREINNNNHTPLRSQNVPNGTHRVVTCGTTASGSATASATPRFARRCARCIAVASLRVYLVHY